MATPLPSLSALRAFEAAGRLGSFTRAAEELKVTQAAVSHQVRSLEAQLDMPLFRRTTRKLELTPAGARLLPAASSAFAQLIAAIAELRRGDSQIAVTTTPGFGVHWLSPRLGRFSSRHPDWDLTIRHTRDLLDLEQEGLDAGLRWGSGAWPGLAAELVTASPLVPVASPDLLRAHQVKAPRDLAGITLLHDEDSSEWIEWLVSAGLDPQLAQNGLIIDDGNALIQAALEGQGMALLSRELIVDALADGSLVQPLSRTLAEDHGYYLVYPPSRRGEPKLEALRAFLLEEGAGRRT